MMYNHISGKCKALAKAICWIGMIGSIIGGAALIIAGIETYGYNQTLYIVIGAATVLLGPLFSWLGSIVIYAIGEAAENSAIAANLIIKADQEREQEKKMTAFSSPETVEMTAIHPSQPNSQQAAEPEPVVREQHRTAAVQLQDDERPAAEPETVVREQRRTAAVPPQDDERPAAEPEPVVREQRRTAAVPPQDDERPAAEPEPVFREQRWTTAVPPRDDERPASEPEPVVREQRRTAVVPPRDDERAAAKAEPAFREQRQAAGTLQHENTAPAAVMPAILPDTAQMPIRNAVRCPECGKELSARASVCPNCGAPIAGKKIPVHFERKKSFAGSANTGSVIIDGLTVGSAGNGTSFDVMLTPGIHNVVIQSQTQGVLAAGRNYSTTLEIPDSAKRVNVTIVVKTDTQSFLSGGMAIVIGDIQIIK